MDLDHCKKIFLICYLEIQNLQIKQNLLKKDDLTFVKAFKITSPMDLSRQIIKQLNDSNGHIEIIAVRFQKYNFKIVGHL